MIILLLYLVLFNPCSDVPGRMPPPPGTISLSDSLFIDSQFISKENYHEFLYFIKMSEGLLNIDYSLCLPDSNINYMGRPYLTFRRYKEDYPILNLNNYQIESYCKWRSWAVNLWKNNPEKRSCKSEYWDLCDLYDPSHLYEVIYFRPDSLTINSIKSKKRIKISEEYCQQDISTKEYTKKYFGITEIYGFRCAAKYILRK